MLDTLHEWQTFYVLIGGAAATLIGMMFVAVSLGSHLIGSETASGMRTYVSPTLFHFVVVLVLSGVVLVPVHTTASLAITLSAVTLIGLRQIFGVLYGLRLHSDAGIDEDNHWLWHGLLPFLSYVVAGGVAIGLALSGDPTFLTGLAFTAMLLLICAIHNTWILVQNQNRQRLSAAGSRLIGL